MLYNEKKHLENIVSYKPVQIFIILLVVFANEIKITDLGLHFDGSQVTTSDQRWNKGKIPNKK
ncbi:hypothetical protein [Algibacter sp. L3A6]|uniref:hypothetical protein n=1 Tax=Algibacter sp. L3A6 TaxID=2686366 RepID=UPI00131D5DB2|nr:hypothetical protein [Algibacter sp. L3A6]